MTETDQEHTVRLLLADVNATIGAGYDEIVRENAHKLREFCSDPADYRQRVVGDVQQQLHDEFIDTSWPACPRHPHAPLGFRDGVWWCEHDGQLIAPLGSLPPRQHPANLQVWGLQFSRPAEDGGPQLSLGHPSVDPIFADFWMLEGHGIPWINALYWLDRLFGYGFAGVSIHYQPWWPGREAKLSALKAGLPGTYQQDGGTLAGAVGPPCVLRRVLETREACGGPNSGLWLVLALRPGRSVDYGTLAKWGGPPLQIAVENRASLLTALALDEGGLGTLLVHRQHAERDRLWELKAWLSAQAR